MKLLNKQDLDKLVEEPFEKFLSRLDLECPESVDAIPVEWIKKWKEKVADGSLCCGPFDLFDPYEYEEAIGRLLNDWEEEDGSDK